MNAVARAPEMTRSAVVDAVGVSLAVRQLRVVLLPLRHILSFPLHELFCAFLYTRVPFTPPPSPLTAAVVHPLRLILSSSMSTMTRWVQPPSPAGMFEEIR